MGLFALMFTSRRLNSIVGSNEEAWTQAGRLCMPRYWQVLSLSDSRYTSTSVEARMMLKYALIHERQCLQALVSADFAPYCLKSTGLQLNALSRALPSARYSANELDHALEEAATPSAPRRAGLKRSKSIPAEEYGHTEEIEASPLSDSQTLEYASSLPGSVEVAIENPLAHSSSEASEIADDDDASEMAHGGETLQVDLTDVVIADSPGALKKHYNPIHRGISKLIHVATGRSKARKARSNSEGTPVASKPITPAKKRTFKFEESYSAQGHSSGADEAWFKLPTPSDVALPNFTPGRWRIMSEANLLASVLSVYNGNERLISTGAYMVRKLCFIEPATTLEEEGSIRSRLANTSIVSVLLEALRQFKKNHVTVSSILVALGNLAISRTLATQIGDRGLSLIVSVMSLHRSATKVIEYGTFLLLNICDERVEYKRKLRSLGMPQLVVKILDKFVSTLLPNRNHPAVIAADHPTGLASASTASMASGSASIGTLSLSASAPSSKTHAPIASATSSSSLTSSLKSNSTSSASSSSREQLSLSIQPAIDLQLFLRESQLSSENEDDVPESPRSREQAGGSGGSTEADLSTAETDEETSTEDYDSTEESVQEYLGDEEEAKDEKACKWMLKKRPHFAQLQADFAHRRTGELAMMRRLLDLMSVLGSDYDIIKPELAIKTVNLLGDLTIALFGCPWPQVDTLLGSAFRTLIVIFEWEGQSRELRDNALLVRSLSILSKLFMRSHIPLKYSPSCNLVIFSLVWKKWDQNAMRKRLVNLIVSSLRLLVSEVDAAKANRSEPVHFSSTTSSSASMSSLPEMKSNKNAFTWRPASIVIPSAAMLGDMAHAFYELRGYIRDTGVLQVLKSLHEDEDLLEEAERGRLADALDEFEDNPLLRGRHRQRQQIAQQNQQLRAQQAQDQADANPAPAPAVVAGA